MLCSISPVLAENCEINGIYYQLYGENNTAEVIGSSSSSYKGTIVLPKSVIYNRKTYTVNSIGDAFSGCTELTSITIPNSILRIGGWAFYGCTGLTSVSIPNSVTEIGSEAFSGCVRLTSVTIPNSVIKIGDYAFSGCTRLTSITIPNSITEIHSGAFYGCTGLTSVAFNAEKCTNMGSVTYPAFSGCTNLTTLTIGEMVTTIPAYAFCELPKISSVVIPNSVTTIGNSAFAGCNEINYVAFNAEECTEMGSYEQPVFSNCPKLSTITIGEKATIIPNFAFDCCEELVSITIGGLVSSIGKYAFAGCKKLTNISMPNSIVLIGDNAFSNCTGLTSVTIPNSVTEIGRYAFSGCSGLTSMIIPNSVKHIREYAFWACPLEAVSIGNSVSTIEANTFASLHSLKTIIIGSGVESINDAFGAVKIIWLPKTPPNGYEKAGAMINYVPNNLYTELPDKRKIEYKHINSIFDVNGVRYVLVDPSKHTCDAIDCTYSPEQTEITINETVSRGGDTFSLINISPYAFNRNTHIKTANINHKGGIGDNSFYACTSLKRVTVGDNIEKIDEMAFGACLSLNYFHMGSSIKVMGSGVFSDCAAIATFISTAVVPPTCSTKYGQDTFGGINGIDKNMCELFVPKESINLYKAAEQWKEFFFISEYDGVDDVSVDTLDALYEVYNLQGVRVGSGMREAEVTTDALPHGVYILVSPQGRKKLKI